MLAQVEGGLDAIKPAVGHISQFRELYVSFTQDIDTILDSLFATSGRIHLGHN